MKKALLPVILVVAAGAAYAQTAREMDTLLETRILTYGQAVRFSFAAAEIMTNNSVEEAFALAQSKGWIPPGVGSQYPVKFDKAAFLLMKSFNLQGGLLYRLFPGPRYAYRELVYRRIIRGPVDSSMTLSGEEFLNILGRILDLVENSAEQTGEGRDQ
jgi:hypothetical protein